MQKVPTVADLHARRLEATRAALEDVLITGDLGHVGVVVESLTDEFDVVEVAMAAVKLAHEAVAGPADEDEIPDASAPTRVARPRQGQGGKGDRGKAEAGLRRARGAQGPTTLDRAGATARVYVGPGGAAGVRPQDLVGAIAGETRLTGRDVGAIEITDRSRWSRCRGRGRRGGRRAARHPHQGPEGAGPPRPRGAVVIGTSPARTSGEPGKSSAQAVSKAGRQLAIVDHDLRQGAPPATWRPVEGVGQTPGCARRRRSTDCIGGVMSDSHRIVLPTNGAHRCPDRRGGRHGHASPRRCASPFDGARLGDVPLLGDAEVDRAVAAAKAALHDEPLPPWQRAEILDNAATLLRERQEEFARIIAHEAAKPIKTARVEADRAVGTFAFAAVEARKLTGEMVPIDAAPGGDGKLGFTMRVPIGVVGAISPFNFPLNLVAHKVAPAIAAGCPVVLKPAGQTPFCAITLAGC